MLIIGFVEQIPCGRWKVISNRSA